MLLLHISDIHFKHPICSTQMDPDRPYRIRLVQDVQERTEQLGPVDAILLTGDIAYKGAPEEYDAALEWLLDLAEKCGCPSDRILIVPGNHDVDRRVIIESPSVKIAQQFICKAHEHRREKEFFELFNNSDTGRALLTPHSAYNNFAARFNCQIYSPDRLFWKQDLLLNDSTILRVFGLTSTILSGAGLHEGKEDNKQSLYLSPLQTAFSPEDGVINLVMSHHPPDWFMDHDIVDEAICERAMIHLFGHKHQQRITPSMGYIRFAAGAVNPNRYEVRGGEPGYNLIELYTENNRSGRFLNVKAHLLVLQRCPERYHPIIASDGKPVFRQQLPIPGKINPATRQTRPATIPTDVSTLEVTKVDEGQVFVKEGGMTDELMRNLVFRFWTLASSQRRNIMSTLGLISETDLALPEPERYGRALVRAKEAGLLKQIAQKIQQLEER